MSLAQRDDSSSWVSKEIFVIFAGLFPFLLDLRELFSGCQKHCLYEVLGSYVLSGNTGS